ncbi:MAG: hypothetical protein JAY66_00380 [Candidatus Thiodiazotropha taylori]|nr:hypothetical protein [Candidatus Thiodiazotropha taylori]
MRLDTAPIKASCASSNKPFAPPLDKKGAAREQRLIGRPASIPSSCCRSLHTGS